MAFLLGQRESEQSAMVWEGLRFGGGFRFLGLNKGREGVKSREKRRDEREKGL